MITQDGTWDYRCDAYKGLVRQNRDFERKAALAIAELECGEEAHESVMEALKNMRDEKP